MDIELLADRPESIPTIARWYFHEWGHVDDSNGYEKTCTHIQSMLNRDHAPLHVLAVQDGRVLGVAQWKLREMDIYPDREHWVGGVYVSNESRGRGIASRLCVRAAQIAGSFGVDRLYLQTEKPDGGLYVRLGWQPIEKVHYHGVDVLVMGKDLGGGGQIGSEVTDILSVSGALIGRFSTGHIRHRFLPPTLLASGVRGRGWR